jgi:hypothetical protein
MNTARTDSARVQLGGRAFLLATLALGFSSGTARADDGESRAPDRSPAQVGSELTEVSQEDLLTCEAPAVPLAPRACRGPRDPRDPSGRAIVGASFPGEWRRGLKLDPPKHRLLGLEGGQVISPSGPVPYEADTAGRWLPGYRPGTPDAQRTLEQWKQEERLRQAGRRSTETGAATTSPASNLWRAGMTSAGMVKDDRPIEYSVREETYEASKLDLRNPPEILAATPKATGPETEYHSSGLTWDEYIRLKELVESAPPTIDGQEATESAPAPSPFGVSFDALVSDFTSTPPDPILAAGPNHLISVVNTRYQVWNKTGAALTPPITLNTFFQGVANCSGAFDPFVDYDEASDRFVIGGETIQANGNAYVCMAASATNDPTGVWNRYSFRGDAAVPTTFLDYPHMGIGLDAVYISANMFNETGTFSHIRAFAVSKTAMYAGTPITVAEADLGGAFFTGQPAKLHGFTSGGWPAPGTPHHIVASNLGGLTRIWRWINPFVQAPTTYGTVSETFTGAPPNAPELGGGLLNDTDNGQYFDAEYRGGKLWATRGVGCNFGGGGAEACVDWVVFDVSGASPFVLGQQSGGAYGSTNDFRYYPDISVDRANNIAIGYTKSSPSTYTEVWVTGREFTDPPGTLEPEILVRAGQGNYTDGAGCNGTCDRWGDYSGMTIDPDGCTFWYLGEFSDGGNFNWKTHIASFKYASCTVGSSVGMDRGFYTCSDSVTVSVTDDTALTASAVAAATTIRALDTVEIDIETIPASQWTGSGCAGGACTSWTAVLPVSSSLGGNGDGTLNVVDGGSIRTTYNDPHPGHSIRNREVGVSCQTRFDDGGFLIAGGCEQGAGAERYRDYLDGGEYIAYTVGLFNPPSAPSLDDVEVSLTISGPAASYITVVNPTVHVGSVAQGQLAGAVFNMFVDPAVDSATYRLSQHDFVASITSPADGYTVPQVLVQQQLVQTDDNIEIDSHCFNHETSQGFVSARYVASYPCGSAEGCVPSTTVNTVQAPWTRGAGCLSETRTDHPDMTCDVGGTSAFKSNPTAGSCSNFPQSSSTLTDDILYSPIFGPAHTGNAANGQPWNFQWRYAEWFYRSDMVSGGATAAATGLFWDPFYPGVSTPAQNEIDGAYPIITGYFVYPNQSWASGTPWNPAAPPANYDSVAFGTFASGEATPGMQWRWATELYDADFGANPNTTAAVPGLAVDDMNLVYEQYHATAQIGTCSASTAPATVSFDQYNYMTCPSGTLELRVMDGNGVGPLTLTVTSDATGDTETLTLSGAGPHFTALLSYDTAGGVGEEDGVLFVTPDDIVRASYNDASPVATSTASAFLSCRGGAVVVDAIVDFVDNGDGDAFADTNETVNLTLRLRNTSAQTLTNVVATLATDSPHVECQAKAQASFGTIPAAGTATNSLALDPFTFKVSGATQCSNPSLPPDVTFTVLVTGDGFDGTTIPQRLTLRLDLNDLGSTTLTTENFTVQPAGFVHQLGPGDDDGNTVSPDGNTCAPYVDEAFWRGTGGNPGGGMFVWTNPAANFPASTYGDLVDSVILSPVVTLPAGATGLTLAFDHEYGFGSTATLLADGARVDYSVNGGPFQKLKTLPYDGRLVHNSYCNPLCNGLGPIACFTENAGNGENVFALLDSGVRFWTRVSGEVSGLGPGDQVRFRWRVGTMDLSFYGIPQNGGYGLDNVTIGARQQACDTAVRPDEGCSVGFASAGNLVQLCGNDDNVVEPSEIWSVDVTLQNLASANAVNTQADLVVNAGSGVGAIVSGAGDFGTIPGNGGTSTETYQFEVDAGAACIDDLVFDVRNIADSIRTHPDVLQAFDVVVGAIETEQTATQVQPLEISNSTGSSNLSPAFTAPAGVGSATLDYALGYEVLSSAETATRPASFTATNNTVANTMTPAFTIAAGNASTASLTWTTLTYTGGNLDQCTRVFLRTPNATEVTLKALGSPPALPYNVLSIYQGPNGGSGTYSIGLEERVGGGCNSTATLGGVSMTVNSGGIGSSTANVRISLFDGAVSHVLKAFGAPDGSPYDVTSIYNAAGPATYQITVQENAGGTAFLSGASMHVVTVKCEQGCSGVSPPPPPVADGVTGSEVTVRRGVGPNDLIFNIDAATCSADHAVVLYGSIGDYSDYQGAVDVGCNVGAGQGATVTHAGSNVWFNVIWVNANGVGGHPGFASSGPRPWTASGLCGVATDDASDNTCN